MSRSGSGRIPPIIMGVLMLAMSVAGAWGVGRPGATGPRAPWLIFGAIAVVIIVAGARERFLSPESRAKRLRVGRLAMGRPVAPALAYRAPPLGARASAREVYASALPTLPLRLLPETPGRMLRYSLRIQDRGVGWILLVFGVIWNAITLIGGGAAIASGKTVTILFMVPFVLAGVVVTWFALHKILGRRKLGSIEIDAEPAFAGAPLEIFVSQPGPATINRFEATLRCQERATYRVGTSSRTEAHTVFEQSLVDEGPFVIPRGLPWQRRTTVTLPDGPPSFKSESNEIAWTILVKADIDQWPDYEESFELRVVPRVTKESGA